MKCLRTVWYVNVGTAGVEKTKSIIKDFKKDIESQLVADNVFTSIAEQRIYVPVKEQITHCETLVFDS